MTPRRTSPAEAPPALAPARPALRFVIVTMDSHLASAAARAGRALAKATPGVSLVVHAATEWNQSETALARDLGCTSRAVRNYLAELKTADLVTIEPHIGNQPTRYHLRFVA